MTNHAHRRAVLTATPLVSLVVALTAACEKPGFTSTSTSSQSAVPPTSTSSPSAPTPQGSAAQSDAPDVDGTPRRTTDESRHPTSPSFRLRPRPPETPATVVASCAAKAFYYEKVRDACERGGFYAVRALMKKQVSRAKAAGKKVGCKSCHRSIDTYSLKDNAVEDLEPWL